MYKLAAKNSFVGVIIFSMCLNAFALEREYYESLCNNNVEKKKLHISDKYLKGRAYYEKLLKKDVKSWVIQSIIYTQFAAQGFSEDSQVVPLSQAFLGEGDISLEDIYLVARLSNQNKIRIVNQDAGPFERPAGSSEGFGTFASDQFLALLADMSLGFDFESQEAGVKINGSYAFALDQEEKIQGSIGFLVPIRRILHIANSSLNNGKLLSVTSTQFNSFLHSSLTQFSRNYNSINDFFNREVLGSKGLSLKSRQALIGFGDISLFGLVELGKRFDLFDSLQAGINLVIPTGGCNNQTDAIFAPSLGSKSVQFDFFINSIWKTRAPCFNPVVHFVGSIVPEYTTKERLPVYIVNPSRVQIGDSSTERSESDFFNKLRFPVVYRSYYVDQFNEVDSTVPAFASNVFPVKVSTGGRVLFGFGNYSYDFFGTGFDVAIFYDIIHKKKDKIRLHEETSLSDVNVDFESVESRSYEKMQAVSWKIGYQFSNFMELNVGSQHVLFGTNVARTNEIYLSFIALF